jgi:hypothetical protein
LAGLSFGSSCAEVVELGIVLVTISGVVEHRDSLPKRYSSENGAQRSWLIDTSISCR